LCSIESGELLQIQGTVRSKNEERTMLMTIDTAATLSCIRETSVPKGADISVDNPATRVIGANGLPLQTKGTVVLDVTIQNGIYPHPFLVVKEGLPHDVLLGTPFLHKFVDCISLIDGAVTFKDGNEARTREAIEPDGAVYLNEHCVVPPFQEVEALVRVHGQTGTVEIYPTTKSKNHRSSLWRVANAVADVNGTREILIRLANFSDETIQVPTGTKVAHVAQKQQHHLTVA
jgi:hypothetical protein